ncbi:hypothetical protein CBB_2724 [Clostridium botulinum Bf]|uniref:Uncharacterized protein n=1 Tax=Clostridium botulinum (strain 657 / Type Ba4) TaxID=515621 RepID=A0A3F3A6J5_CLOB6|nr:hypothetical protein CLJ_B2712 [Clostridium botulinum Ba4 str. 657]EDT86059.1 hypothetical protein CBB_2724 [Clostridium botulinum Bf]KGO13508.1 hypothetical protein NZ45_12315 [Clostridium botulinum]KIN82475.1 hypothetical protein SD74_04525 [Clostridium botulinum]
MSLPPVFFLYNIHYKNKMTVLLLETAYIKLFYMVYIVL